MQRIFFFTAVRGENERGFASVLNKGIFKKENENKVKLGQDR